MDTNLVEAFQAQYNLERHNRDAYTCLAWGFTAQGLTGLAKWASRKALEEAAHANKVGDYLTDKRGVLVQLRALPACVIEFSTPLQAFQAAATVEAVTTDAIHNLYAMADEMEDYDAAQFLLWFVEEQRQSEAEFKTWIARLNLIVGDGAGILAFDRELA